MCVCGVWFPLLSFLLHQWITCPLCESVVCFNSCPSQCTQQLDFYSDGDFSGRQTRASPERPFHVVVTTGSRCSDVVMCEEWQGRSRLYWTLVYSYSCAGWYEMRGSEVVAGQLWRVPHEVLLEIKREEWKQAKGAKVLGWGLGRRLCHYCVCYLTHTAPPCLCSVW